MLQELVPLELVGWELAARGQVAQEPLVTLARSP